MKNGVVGDWAWTDEWVETCLFLKDKYRGVSGEEEFFTSSSTGTTCGVGYGRGMHCKASMSGSMRWDERRGRVFLVADSVKD